MRNDLLTVSAFADVVGVSKQALYKQIQNPNSQLYPFVVKQGKRCFIALEAVKEVYKIDNPETTENQPEATENNREQTTLTTKETTENQPLTTQFIEQLKEQINQLQEEKEQLAEQIQEKDRTIKEQADKIASLAERVAEIADKAIIATQQQQYLTATEKKQLTDGKPDKKGFLFWKRKKVME